MTLRALKIGMLCWLILLSGCRSFNSNFETVASKQNHEVHQQLDGMYSLARIAERNGSTAQAIKAHFEILRIHPDFGPSLHRMGVISCQRANLAQAMSFFNQAVDAGESSAELMGDIGFALYLQGDLEAAEDTLKRAAEKDPTNKRIINNLAVVAGKQEQYTESINLFRQVGTEAESLAGLAFVQSQTGQIENAKANYHRALELDPDLSAAANGLVELDRLGRGRLPVTGNANQNVVTNPEQVAMSQTPERKPTPLVVESPPHVKQELAASPKATTTTSQQPEIAVVPAAKIPNRDPSQIQSNQSSVASRNIPATYHFSDRTMNRTVEYETQKDTGWVSLNDATLSEQPIRTVRNQPDGTRHYSAELTPTSPAPPVSSALTRKRIDPEVLTVKPITRIPPPKRKETTGPIPKLTATQSFLEERPKMETPPPKSHNLEPRMTFISKQRSDLEKPIQGPLAKLQVPERIDPSAIPTKRLAKPSRKPQPLIESVSNTEIRISGRTANVPTHLVPATYSKISPGVVTASFEMPVTPNENFTNGFRNPAFPGPKKPANAHPNGTSSQSRSSGKIESGKSSRRANRN